MPGAAERSDEVAAWCAEREIPYFAVSAVTGDGIGPLIRATCEAVTALRRAIVAEEPEFEASYVHTPDRDREIVVTRALDGGRDVAGGTLERVVIQTEMQNEESVAYLQRRLNFMGVESRLRAAGARDGDTVHIGPVSFEFETYSADDE